MYRTTDGGATWADPVVLETGIAEFGSQGIGPVRATVLPSGEILLTYFYMLAPFPNYSSVIKVWSSTDNGANGTQLADKPNESGYLAISQGGQVVSTHWVDDGQGNLSFHSSTYDRDSDAWTDRGLIMSFDPICSHTLHVTSDTEWSDEIQWTGGTPRQR